MIDYFIAGWYVSATQHRNDIPKITNYPNVMFDSR